MSVFDENETRVPLKSIEIDAVVVDLVASVSITQTFEKNVEESPVEVFYKFPIDDSAAVYEFEANVDGHVVFGKVEKKADAETRYARALNEGKFAALVDDEAGDVFAIRLGNFRKKVVVRLSYASLLKYESGRAVFYAPTTLAPRYNTTETSFVNNLAPHCPYTVSLTLDCAGAVATSPSHAFETLSDGKIRLSKAPADRDIVFYIDFARNAQATAVYQKVNADLFVAMATWLPKMSPVEMFRGEFVFLVDRSGSMEGIAIKQARDAMMLILASIPVGSYFNIIGFGSHFEELFADGSREYTQETLEEAKRCVRNLDANMGGTEIFAPLQKVLSRPNAAGFQKQIFVLTDGQVANVGQIVSLIATRKGSCRVFSMGLGSCACHALVNGMARAGNGVACYSSFSEKIGEKMVKLMQLAMKRSAGVPMLEWNAEATATIPEPHDPAFEDCATVSFGWFSNAPSVLTVDAVAVDVRDASEKAALALYRLSAKRQIQQLEDKYTMLQMKLEESRCDFFSKRAPLFDTTAAADSKQLEKIEADIVKLSLECNIVCKFTSFVAVGNSIVFESGQRRSITVANQMPFGSGAAVCDSAGPRTQSAGAASAGPLRACALKARFSCGGDDDDASCGGDDDDAMDVAVDFDNQQALVNYIVACQKFDGSFVVDDRLAAKIGCPLERVDRTAFVVDYLEKFCDETRAMWMLVAQKARDYLARL